MNLLLIAIAVAGFAWAKHQRDVIREKTAILFRPSPTNPAELIRVRNELSQLKLTHAQLEKELDTRLEYLKIVNGEQFYIAIDTARKKFEFRFGPDVVRDADVTIGPAKTISTPDKSKTWTFVPVKGGFTVAGKETDYDWPVPDWTYAMRGESPPAAKPSIPNGLGKYVILLPDNYVIHTPPPPDSPLNGEPKPGSIMVPEADLAAIWPRITTQTRVYIF